MLDVAKQQTEHYAKSLNKTNRDSTDCLATIFVPKNTVFNSKKVSL